MSNRWTFGRTMAAGFAAVMLLNLTAGGIALAGVRGVVASKDRVITVESHLEIQAGLLLQTRAERTAAFRAYLLTGTPAFLDQTNQGTVTFNALIGQIRKQVHTTLGRELITKITADAVTAQATLTRLVALKQSGAGLDAIIKAFNELSLQRTSFMANLAAFSAHEAQLAKDGVQSSNATASRDTKLIIGVLIGTILATLALAASLTRYLRQRIGSVVGEVQSSSTELQATANQQAVGAIEQATAMSEISTTITELLATSRQITDSAQRVADTADKTAGAGRSGQETVTSAQHSMGEIRRQMDTIVNHMLELGDRSQRIGVVLDIVSELAEQTNILAINSTIEAAGAGESGKRFAVVADEIRKLADRVAESTKEIRNLIDVVRSAVHTTVLATEIGSKAVDAGSAQFDGVASAFEKIVGLVTTTTESAREIELSTKQQTAAVEQVNFAVANVTQTTKESETSSTQTLQTAAQLTELSTKLLMLVEPMTTA